MALTILDEDEDAGVRAPVITQTAKERPGTESAVLDQMAEAPEGIGFDFYGVDDRRFKLGGHVFEAIEDPNDGYRSYLQSIEVDPVSPNGTKSIFFAEPVATVRVRWAKGRHLHEIGQFTGFYLEDVVDGHIWLVVGTDYSDDYYPCFTFGYKPKAPPVHFTTVTFPKAPKAPKGASAGTFTAMPPQRTVLGRKPVSEKPIGVAPGEKQAVEDLLRNL